MATPLDYSPGAAGVRRLALAWSCCALSILAATLTGWYSIEAAKRARWPGFPYADLNRVGTYVMGPVGLAVAGICFVICWRLRLRVATRISCAAVVLGFLAWFGAVLSFP